MAHILILESGHQPLAGAIAAQLCRDDGHTTVQASARGGLPDWIEDERPDVVMLDVPRTVGQARWLLGQLRRRPALAKTPVVALVKGPRNEAMAAAAASACCLVLACPYRPSMLLHAVATLTGRGPTPAPLPASGEGRGPEPEG